jgi:hypothetical protein
MPHQQQAIPAAEITAARIVARVGPEVILYGDVVPGIDDIRATYRGKISDAEIEAQLKEVLRKRLPPHIETKLVYWDAKRTIPPENFPHIEESLGKLFEKKEIKDLMKRLDVASRRELEQKLDAAGTSLERQRRAFTQKSLAQQWVRQQIKRDKEITFDQLVAYYHEHRADFDNPARARWEQLTVGFSRHPTKADARAAVARLGNQVLDGKPLADVAREHSDGPTAADGGRRDWTTQGSLVCEGLDRALFGLPLERLSPIIEGPDGFHIIRVTERMQAGLTPFEEAQVDIREKIRRQRTNAALQAYMKRLRDEIPVWTIFDDSSTGDPRKAAL